MFFFFFLHLYDTITIRGMADRPWSFTAGAECNSWVPDVIYIYIYIYMFGFITHNPEKRSTNQKCKYQYLTCTLRLMFVLYLESVT